MMVKHQQDAIRCSSMMVKPQQGAFRGCSAGPTRKKTPFVVFKSSDTSIRREDLDLLFLLPEALPALALRFRTVFGSQYNYLISYWAERCKNCPKL